VGRLQGKIAVVTGGASGIGQAFARRLGEDGAAVAVADVKDCAETKALVEGAGARFHAARCDVTDPQQVASFAAGVVAALGHPDILINNAGIFPLQPFSEISFADWRRINAINVDSMFLFAQAIVPGMIARKSGRIVNMTSTVNWLMIPNYVHYITTKAAVIGFTRGLANELGEHGITVNAIAPSLVRNATTQASELSQMYDVIAQQQAIHRVQVPSDLVGTMSFLVSEDAAFVTGQTIAVDGGMTKG
jgi:3-oxoacyl-[acyl-carrier protein] reductase/(S)-1-phenylethanol dehydrogenase